MDGTYREIVEPARLVTTELYDADRTGDESLATVRFRQEVHGTILMVNYYQDRMNISDLNSQDLRCLGDDKVRIEWFGHIGVGPRFVTLLLIRLLALSR